SMLLQAGGPLTQDRIQANLGLHIADVSRTLEAMERAGRITREWLPLEYTYLVYRTEDEARRSSNVPKATPQTSE
ncbi:MAG: hypothetical protein ACYC1C_09155, partial [Chloroflexota bacterium]